MAVQVHDQLEEFSFAILDSVEQEIVVIDRTGKIIFANNAWKQFGLENGVDKDWIGVNYFHSCEGEVTQQDPNINRLQNGLKDVIAGRLDCFDHEYPCHSPVERKWFMMTIVKMTGYDSFVITHNNITARKLAEEKVEAALAKQQRQNKILQALEEKQKRLLHNLPVGIVVHARDSTVTFSNPRASELLELSLDRMLGKVAIDPAWRFLNEGGQAMDVADYPVSRVMASQQPLNVSILGIHSPKREFIVWLSVAAFPEKDDEGNLKQIIVTFHDISDRIRLEKMKSEFISTVNHELRTPLTSIAGSLSLIVNEVFGKIPPQIEQLASVAHRNSLRLTHIINDLLDMDKLAAGKVSFDMREHAVVPILKRAIEDNRNYQRERQIDLVFIDRPELTHIRLRCDEQRLMQVLSNLLSNAIKFSPDRGQVQIDCQFSEERTDQVKITVTDQGTGIPIEFHKRIFQKFSQVDSSDVRQRGGTGLGLAISRELIERMGGSIGFTSVVGQGSCFYIVFPIIKSQPV